MKISKTQLLMEYVDLSWNFNFPEEIELIVERDFVENQHLYDINTIKRIATYLLISPEIDEGELLEIVRIKR